MRSCRARKIGRQSLPASGQRAIDILGSRRSCLSCRHKPSSAANALPSRASVALHVYCDQFNYEVPPKAGGGVLTVSIEAVLSSSDGGDKRSAYAAITQKDTLLFFLRVRLS